MLRYTNNAAGKACHVVGYATQVGLTQALGAAVGLMLAHTDFAKLRLSQFVDPSEVALLEDWEFLGREWVGEAIGFTEWLRPKSSPDALESLTLDLSELPHSVTDACLTSIGLPLTQGMELAQLIATLGEPHEVLRFVEDRASYEFRAGAPDAYDVSCTVLADGGLTYLVVTAGTARGGA